MQPMPMPCPWPLPCRLVHCSRLRLHLPGLPAAQEQALAAPEPSSSSFSFISNGSATTTPRAGGGGSSMSPLQQSPGAPAAAAAPPAPGAITSLQWLSFCRATDTPALLAVLRDSSVCVLRLNEVWCPCMHACVCVCMPGSMTLAAFRSARRRAW